jgi:hypothetical protein
LSSWKTRPIAETKRHRITPLTTVYFPVTFAVISKMEQPIPGIVALAAAWTNEIASPLAPVLIVVLGDCECGAATARDKE